MSGWPQSTTIALKKYKSQNPSFSFLYPADLEATKWPEGASVAAKTRTDVHVLDLFYVSDDAFPVGFSDYAFTPGKYFRRLRNAKSGRILKRDEGERCKKISNLLVDGYPAVKIECSSSNELTKGSDGAPPPPIGNISVYVMKGRRYWEMSVTEIFVSGVSNDVRQPFEQILSSFRFR